MNRDNAQSETRRPAVVLLVNSLGVGGAERHTIALANLLSDRFRVVLAYLKPADGLATLLDKDRLEAVCSLDVRSRIDRTAARALADLAHRHGARMILCANGFALLYAQLARALSPVPLQVLVVFHTNKLGTWKERVSMALYWPLFRAAHHLIFVCDGQRRRWRRFGLRARHTGMIYNGVDLAYFDPAPFASQVAAWRTPYGWSAEDRVVGICAALRPEKAHVDLLKAVARRRDAGQRWRVLIVGDGPMRGVIEASIAELGLGEDVAITGYLSDVRAPLTACDVVALVSKTEAFSIASLEAMAMGKPMIMSDVGGAREQVIDGVNGFLFPCGDIEALADRLRECWDRSRCQLLGRQARQRVETEFSQPTMVARYTELLEQAAAS